MNYLDEIVKIALAEDIGDKDVTTEAIVSEKTQATAKLIAKQDLVVAGLEVAKKVLHTFDKNIKWIPQTSDGDFCENGNLIAQIEGRAKSILITERTVLNFLQKLCGIATITNIFVKSIEHTKVKILDTRKTTPGMRGLEKYAVLMGNGENHRMGLFDRYLIKDNHIEIAGSIKQAVEKINKHRNNNLLLEIETTNIDQVREALECKADIIMLDNMTVNEVKEAVKIVKGRVKLEVSGNITLDTIISYALTGVDYISIGALTHSAPSADISMIIKNSKS